MMAPVSIKVVFQGAVLEGIIRDGRNYVAMRPVVEGMGLDWASQTVKIHENPALQSTVVEIPTVAEDGKKRTMLCLPEEMLPFWMALVNAKKVKPELREKVIRFQVEAARVLHKAFSKGRVEVQDWSRARLDAAARYQVMSEVLMETRADQGKETKSFHYSNEAIMVNEVCFGTRKPVDRDALSKADLRLLNSVEAKNTVMIGRGQTYAFRKGALSHYVAQRRAKLAAAQEPALI